MPASICRTPRPRTLLFLPALALALLATGTHADVITYTAALSGPAEAPPNTSPGIGFGQVDFDLTAHSMHVHVDFSGLLGTTTASHVHSATAIPGQGTAMVATQLPTFVGFPLGVMAGTYDNAFDTSLASTWNPAFVTAHGGTVPTAEAFFSQSLADGTAYLNIHSNLFPGGEIRGFLLVPAPGAASLLGLAGLAGMRRRR